MDDNNEEFEIVDTPSNQTPFQKNFKARLIIAALMLALAFICLILLDFHSHAFWFYIKIMCGCYAILSIWLNWFVNRNNRAMTIISIWHQILHWIGLLIMIYIVSTLVSSGMLNSSQAAMVTLILLAFSIFIAGVYTDATFMLIGLTLSAFAIGAALVKSYAPLILSPIIAIAALAILLLLYLQRRKEQKNQ
jgi:hypothetical protein